MIFVETSIGGAVFEVTNLEEPLEVFYQPLEEEAYNFERFENDVVDLNDIQTHYDLEIPKRIFPFQEYGFQELGCDERFPFTPHLRDAEVSQAQYSPSENNFFITYRYADDWMPTLLNLYQGKDGVFLYSIEEDTGILKATYSPDGAFLALATSVGAIKILDVESGQEVRNSHKFQERFYSVTFDIKGEQLLADTGGQVDFYHLQNGVWGGTVDIVRADVYSLSLDTGILAVGDEHGQILYLNVNTRDHVRITQAHNEYVTGVAYSSNGEILASSGADCSIKLWDANGELLNELENLVSPGQDGENTRQKVYNLVFAPNGNYLLGETFTSLLAIWDIDSGKIIRQLRLDIPYFGPQRFYTFAPNQDILAIATFDPEIKFVDMQTFETIQIFTVPVTDGFISQIAFSPDGSLIVATTTNGWMYLWSVFDQSLLVAKRAHVEGINGITFSQDGLLIAVGSSDGTISIWGIAP